jgi:hypothetical protein
MESGTQGDQQPPKHRRSDQKSRDSVPLVVVPDLAEMTRKHVDDAPRPITQARDESRRAIAASAHAVARVQRARTRRERNSRRVATWTLVASVATLAVAVVTLVVSARA